MSEDRKVISLATRQSVSPDSASEVKEPIVDTKTLEMIDNFREMVLTGRMRGAVILSFDTEAHCLYPELLLPGRDFADNEAAMMIGGLKLIESMLTEIINESYAMEQKE